MYMTKLKKKKKKSFPQVVWEHWWSVQPFALHACKHWVVCMDFQDVGSGSVLMERAQVCQAQRKNLQRNNPHSADVKRTRRNINKALQPSTDAGAGAAVSADESVSKDQAALWQLSVYSAKMKSCRFPLFCPLSLRLSSISVALCSWALKVWREEAPLKTWALLQSRGGRGSCNYGGAKIAFLSSHIERKFNNYSQVKLRNMISMDPDDNSFYMLLHQRRNHPVCRNNGAGKWDNCSLLSVFYGQCSGNGFIPQFYIQTVSDIGLFYLVYKWVVSEMDSHLW